MCLSSDSKRSALDQADNCEVHVQVGWLVLSGMTWRSRSSTAAPRHEQITAVTLPETWSMTRRCGTWFAGGFDFGHIGGVPTLHVIITHASTQYASNFVGSWDAS